MPVLWIGFSGVSLLVLIKDLLFLSLYFGLDISPLLFLLLEIFSRQVLHTLLRILSLPFLFYLFLFLGLLHFPIILLNILRRSNPCIFDDFLTPLLFLSLSLHVPALDVDLGVDGRMITD